MIEILLILLTLEIILLLIQGIKIAQTAKSAASIYNKIDQNAINAAIKKIESIDIKRVKNGLDNIESKVGNFDQITQKLSQLCQYELIQRAGLC